MGMKARIEKLEKHIPPDEPLGPACFVMAYDESGVEKPMDSDWNFSPDKQEEMLRAREQGRQVVIFHIPPGTVFKPPRKPAERFAG